MPSESGLNAADQRETAVGQLVDHLFRREAGKMVATLTRSFGFENLNLAEDVVQDALLQAMRSWAFEGIPANPPAWLMKVAKNRALDVVRRERNFHSKEAEITSFLEERSDSWYRLGSVQFGDEIRDDQLRMMFACCHPSLPTDAQTVLILKALCGFNEKEIAAAFLSSTDAVAKRLVRARQKIRETEIALEMPEHGELISRVETVLRALYLLFNEGYKTSQGHELVRKELCEEAIRLGTLLAEHPAGNQPKTHALLALMLFNAARLTTRSDAAGNLLLLAQQDRTLWNQEMIDRGFMHLDQSAAGTEISEFHLEAGIASCHCSAQSYEETNWLRILSLYDSLTEMNSSPVIALNRAVAISNVHGPAAGILAVESIGEREMLDKYYLYHAVLGRLHFKLKHFEEAARRFRRASELTAAKAEQAFLQTKLNECDATLGTDLVLSDERQQYRRTP